MLLGPIEEQALATLSEIIIVFVLCVEAIKIFAYFVSEAELLIAGVLLLLQPIILDSLGFGWKKIHLLLSTGSLNILEAMCSFTPSPPFILYWLILSSMPPP